MIEYGPLAEWKEIAGSGQEMQDVFWYIKEAIDAYFDGRPFQVTVKAGCLIGRKHEPRPVIAPATVGAVAEARSTWPAPLPQGEDTSPFEPVAHRAAGAAAEDRDRARCASTEDSGRGSTEVSGDFELDEDSRAEQDARRVHRGQEAAAAPAAD